MKLLSAITLMLAAYGMYNDQVESLVFTKGLDLQQKYGLKPFGSGRVGPGEAKAFVFSANSYCKPSIEEARLLLVSYTHNLIKNINTEFSKKNLHAPVNEDYICLTIYFIGRDGKGFKETGKVNRISHHYGLIDYDIAIGENEYDTLFIENYADAFKIIGL
jgi:hypothetical protein